ncbi:MAG: YfiR family protein [Cytophagales bacterium]|nr:YfiR family protein [Cytophagales bacterium]
MKRRLLTFIALAFFSVASFAQETKMYSGFIYHFSKLIEWPSAQKQGDFIIAVVGNSDIVKHLNALAKTRKVGTQKIVIKKCSTVAEAQGAHIIYLSDNKLSEFGKAKSVAQAGHSLLLTSKDNYGKNGSMINFVKKGGKLQFEINKASTKQAGLVVSNKLLNLGIVI